MPPKNHYGINNLFQWHLAQSQAGLNFWKATETMFLESIDLYAKNWSKREQVELKYLSEWKDQLKELVTDRISNLKGHFKSPKCKVLDQPDVKDTLHKLHANYVLVPADKAANNVIVVCKKYYILTP